MRTIAACTVRDPLWRLKEDRILSVLQTTTLAEMVDPTQGTVLLVEGR